jgi:hypothetical protein
MPKPPRTSQPLTTNKDGNGEDSIRFTARLPYSLHARLWKSAQQSNRSINAQLVNLLSQAIKHERAAKRTASASPATFTTKP